MAKTPLRFATGASTPLYLPLYVLSNHRGFSLDADYSIELVPPKDPKANGDIVAATQLTNGAAEFALCDPVVAEGNDRLRIVANVVGRLAFWAISKKNIRYLDEFARFKKIFTYPQGMTGHYVGAMVRALVRERTGADQRIVPVPLDTELEALLTERSPAVALTANLLLARRFTTEHRGYEISPLWNLDPAFSSFMLTGLLARVEDIDTQHALVRTVVMGLNRAIALLRTNEDEGVNALRHAGHVIDPAANYFVNSVRTNQLYPTALNPELTSWHNLRRLHLQGGGGPNSATPIKANVPSAQTFFDSVRSRAALEAEELILKTLVQFGKGYLYLDAAATIEARDTLNVSKMIVVGAYRRDDDTHRQELQRWAERIRRGVVTPSKTKENFLIWGTSGSGKSFLVQELGRELSQSGSGRFEEFNLAEVQLKDLKKKLRELEAAPEPLLCLLDEVDSATTLTANYTPIFPALRWRKQKARQSVFVLVGSTTDNVNSLAKDIRSREKGPDLMRFVPSGQWLQIPDYTMWDRLVIFVGSAVEHARKTGTAVTSVEKLALYYVAVVHGGADAGTLSELGEQAVSRMPAGEQRIKYEYLFDPLTGSGSRIRFTAEHYHSTQGLVDRFLHLA